MTAASPDSENNTNSFSKLPVSYREIGWLIAILGLLLVFHLVTIQRQSLFVDEYSELHISDQPFSTILLRPDSMPPLYPLLLKGWLDLTDPGDYSSARWMSALIGIGTVIVLWWAVRDSLGWEIAVVSAALLAMSPFQLYYSQLVRSYALFTLVTILSIGFFARAIQSDRWIHWLAWAATSVVGIFTHYYFAFLGTTLLLVLCVSRKGKVGQRFLIAAAFAILVASPVLLPLKADFGYQRDLRDPRSASPAAIAYTYTSFFTGYTLGPSKTELQTLTPAEAARGILPWLVALAATAGPLAIAGSKKLTEKRALSLILALSIIPILLTALAGTAAGLTYNPRFVVWCVAPIIVLVAAGVCSDWNTKLRVATSVGLVIIFATAVFNRHFVPRYQIEDLRNTADYLVAHASPEQPIFAISDYTAHLLNYYLQGNKTAIELPEPGKQSLVIESNRELEQALREINSRTPATVYWLVHCRPFHGDPQGLLLETLIDRDHLKVARELAGVTIYQSRKPTQ